MTHEEGGPEFKGLPEVAEIEEESHDKLPGPWYLWTGLGLVVLGLVVRWMLRRR